MLKWLGPLVSDRLTFRVTSGLLTIALVTLAVAIPVGLIIDRYAIDEEPVGLVVDPPLLTFLKLNQPITLRVDVMYSGRRIRRLPEPLRASLSFTSDSPTVIAVTPEGVAQALANGGANIQVSAGRLTARVPAFVALPTVTVPAPDPQKLFPLGTDGSAVVLNRVLVGGAPGHDPAAFEQLASRNNAKILVRFNALGAYLLELPTGTPEALIATLGVLSRDPRVAFAIPDVVMAGSERPIDTALLDDDAKKAYAAIGIEPAWRALEKHLSLPSPVTVAIIDSALDFSAGDHEFDSSSFVALEMVEELPKLLRLADRAKHGTAVASVIVAANNGRRASGNQQLSGILTSVPNLPYRVLFYQTGILNPLGQWRGIYMGGVFAAFDDILTKKGQVDVVNMSFGNTCSKPVLDGCAAWNSEKGRKFSLRLDDMPNVVFVAAAGNEDTNAELTFPASLSDRSNLMTVGATEGDARSIWNSSKRSASNYGPKITLGAPGTDVWTVDTHQGYSAASGTSLSAPIVAGVTGLIRSISPALTPEAIKKLLRDTGREISICTVSTPTCPAGKQEKWRLLQADKAIDKALRDAGLLYERVALVGTVPGQFTTTEANFTLSISPRDEGGRLIQSGISESNFSFRDVTASSINNPGEVVSRASVKVVDVDILGTRTPTGRTVMLLFDSSGSMSDSDPGRLRVEAGIKLIGLLKGADKAGILDFGAGADPGRRATRLLQDLTTDTAALKTAMERVTQSGRTPLFDGLLDAMDLIVKSAAPNPVILVMTDGEENASSSRAGAVVERGRQLKVPIFTIGLGKGADSAQLQALARETGGTHASATDAEALLGVFRTIGLGIVEGRIVVTGQGTFQPPIPSAGGYLISGKLETKLGRETFETPFSFVVEVQLPPVGTSTPVVTSAAGLRFIAEHEGFRPMLYNDPSPSGHCTIGYGYLVHRGNCNDTEPQEFRRSGGITEQRALELLRGDVGTAERAVTSLVAVPLNQAQFDALVSFTFNLGGENLRKSDLLKKLNDGNYDAVPAEFGHWVLAGGQKLPGLVKRRNEEATLFKEGRYLSGGVTVTPRLTATPTPVPTATLQPTATPRPTPTPTLVPTATLQPTATPRPTPTPTLVPTATPQPTATPRPTPTPTPVPTATLAPTPTLRPTATFAPTPTPLPTVPFAIFEHSGQPWEKVTSTSQCPQASCLRSGRIPDGGFAITFFAIRHPTDPRFRENPVQGQRISFDVKVSSQACCDRLTFSISGTTVQEWSGEFGWRRVVFALPPIRPLLLQWEYRKDQSISSGEDAAWIGDVVVD